MTFFFADLIGFTVATLLGLLLVVAPGFGAARLFLPRDADPRDASAWSLLCLAGLLPLVYALFARCIALEAAIAIALLLAAIGLAPLWAAIRHMPRSGWIWIAVWWLMMAAIYCDIDIDGRLNQSMVVVDLVKHALTIGTIARDGLPLHDPFVNRPETAGYYYYFYVAGAMIDKIGGALVDSRMAFAATAFYAAFPFPALLWLLARTMGWIETGRERAFLAATLLLFFASGLDLPMMFIRFLVSGLLETQPDLWGNEISFATIAAMWVPHHFSAVIASFTALMLMSIAQTSGKRMPLVGAAVCLAATFGQSVWIAVGVAVVILCWMGWSLVRGRSLPWIALIACGLGALLLSAPQLIDLVSGRSADGFPFGLWIRPFWAGPPYTPWVNLPLIPFSLLLEFGFFALGSWWFLRRYPPRSWPQAPLGSMLIVAVVVGLLCNSFIRSTVINNDFGWRVIWFAQIPAILWTALAMHGSERRVTDWPGAKSLLILGVAASVYIVPAYRLLRGEITTPWQAFLNNNQDDDYALRRAYEWANAHIPRDRVLQHNPIAHARVFDFGLYGIHRTAVADRPARLFGASRELVAERIAAIGPIFTGRRSPAEIGATARDIGIDYLVILRRDPLWAQTVGTDAALRCVYRSNLVCIAPVKDLS